MDLKRFLLITHIKISLLQGTCDHYNKLYLKPIILFKTDNTLLECQLTIIIQLMILAV